MRRTRAAAGGGRREDGFTLIELIAVVLIIGLVAGLALPNLGILGQRRLLDEAQRLAGELELARQRSIMTGVRHRLVLDLDAALYWTECEVAEEEPEPPLPHTGSDRPAPSPPESGRLVFAPCPNSSGRAWRLDEDVDFAAVETEVGVEGRGQFLIPFESDGSTEWARIVLEQPGGNARVLEVRALAETVRILDEAA